MHRIDMHIFCQGHFDVCKYMIQHNMLLNPQHALQYATAEGWVSVTADLLASGVPATPQALILTDACKDKTSYAVRVQAVETCIRKRNIKRAIALFEPDMVLTLSSTEWSECIQILSMEGSKDVLHLYDMEQSPVILTWMLYWGVVYNLFSGVEFALQHGATVHIANFDLRVAQTQDLRIFSLYMGDRVTSDTLEQDFAELFDKKACFSKKCCVQVIDAILTSFPIHSDQKIRALENVCAGNDIDMLECFLRHGIKPVEPQCKSVLNCVRKDGLKMYHLLMQHIPKQNDSCDTECVL